MTTIITRLYAAEDQAVRAVDALKRKFGADQINLVTPASGQGGDLEESIAKGGVPRPDAAIYAERVRQGGSIVTVRAVWGFAKDAIRILGSYGPVDQGILPSDYHHVPGWNEAAPFSRLLGLNVLAKSKSSIILSANPAPFSSIFALPTLSRSKSSAGLLNNPAPFSSLFGLPTISRAKPFSKLVENDKSSSTLL